MRLIYWSSAALKRVEEEPYTVYSSLAAAYALDGKMDEAKSALAEARRLNPKLAIKYEMAHAPNFPHLFEGLQAGLPEE